MKRYFLTVCAIATGVLAMGSTSALAQALPQVAVVNGGVVDVPFATIAAGILPSCLAVPTPGVLAQDGKTLTSTGTGSRSGKIALTCTVGTSLSAGTPTRTTPLGGVAGPTTFSSATSSLSSNVLPTGINIVDVNMVATTTEDVIAAGVYAFTVPVTITYQ